MTRCGTNEPHWQTFVPDSVNGNPLPRTNDALNLPLAEHVGDRTGAVQPTAPLAERQLVAEAEGAAVALVIPREALVGVEVGSERGVVGFNLSGSVVAIFRELIVGEEEQPGGVALLEAKRKTLEIGRSDGG